MSEAVRTLDPVWIPLPDGGRLAATLWLPAEAERRPVPVVLEMIPYRRRDGTVFRDMKMHPWLAAHGIAVARVDLRGSGDSDGLLEDEYLSREQADACAAIAWLAAQPWCTGKVGMTGISWGGFNALQVAALRPPALKAIVTLCSTDDRFADDVHYMGGCLLFEDVYWGSFMLSLNALPPDPQSVGAGWRAAWLARLAANRPWSETWLAHQARDAYWRQGSVCEDWDAIEIPVYAIGGWDDSYSNAVPRLMAGLKGPRKGLVGPWSHFYPFEGTPGPAIGYLQEVLRWWRHWLCGEATGIMEEPLLRLWLQEPERPAVAYESHPGRWIAEAAWPSPRIERRVLRFGDGRLGGAAGEGERQVASLLTAGTYAGRWGGYGGGSPDMAPDQRLEDAQGAAFETLPLAEDLELCGQALVRLSLRCDRPRANLAVRLCGVAPDGASLLLTWGALNLAHRDGPAEPQPLEPGRSYDVTLTLNDFARRLPAGWRLRLSVATQHWPQLWPQPEAATVTLDLPGCSLELPVRPPRPEDAALPPFEPPESAPGVPATCLRPGSHGRRVVDEVGPGRREVQLAADYGRWRLEDRGVTTELVGQEHYGIVEGDPLSCEARCHWLSLYESGEARVEICAEVRLTGSAETFRLEARCRAYDDGALVSDRSWERLLPRRFV